MRIRRKNRGRHRGFKDLSFWKMLPNLATLSALFVGLSQIKFALKEQWEYALLAVVGASILDATDGRIARMFNACSRFGAELDSLSDLVVFGACPSVVMYLYSLSELDRFGWAACSFFAVCMALRLARFNVHDIENITTTLGNRGFSIGVPAPAGAILHLFPIVLYNSFGLSLFKEPYFCIVFSVLASLLCISKIPTFTIKKIHIKKETYTMFLLYIVLAACMIFVFTWIACSVIVFAYTISIFFSASKAKKILKNERDGQISSPE